ncbi:MAG TPA: hypothetical protein VE544_11265 [Nitrososphaeraceae archaeon]|jgi:hypothetical protein|nr:hypothetical protein [Nitrososphaeraceae archaeon]
MSDQVQQQVIEAKSWKYKLERVAKGYVRVTVHSDDLDELISNWELVHSKLREIGEFAERMA